MDKAEMLRGRRKREAKMAKMAQNGHPRIAVPGQEPGVSVRPHQAPLAFPVTVAHPGGNGIVLHVIGGLTPLEWMVGSIASTYEPCDADAYGAMLGEIEVEKTKRNRAKETVAYAAMLLVACQEFCQEQTQEPAEPAEGKPSPILTG